MSSPNKVKYPDDLKEPKGKCASTHPEWHMETKMEDPAAFWEGWFQGSNPPDYVEMRQLRRKSLVPEWAFVCPNLPKRVNTWLEIKYLSRNLVSKAVHVMFRNQFPANVVDLLFGGLNWFRRNNRPNPYLDINLAFLNATRTQIRDSLRKMKKLNCSF